MKYLEVAALSRLAQSLGHEGPECSVHTRIEAYSCKNIKRDKKLFKYLENAYREELSNSPPIPSWLALDREAELTPFGPFDKHASRKTLYLLIATLNVAFPDHEFSDVRPSHFSKEESGASILNSLSTTLLAPSQAGINVPRTYSSYPPTSSDFFPNSLPTSSSPYNSFGQSPYAQPQIVTGTHPSIFHAIDQVIGLSDCEVYSYSPDIEADPHANDFSDDDDDVPSISDEESASDSDEPMFEFDDYDVDEIKIPKSMPIPATTPRDAIKSTLISSSPVSYHMKRRRGALLWSSHWFFLNRKLKRILFISIWARSRGIGRSIDDEEYLNAGELVGERFLGWEGGTGAGARAMGLMAYEG